MRASEDDPLSFFSSITEDSILSTSSDSNQFYSALFEYAQGNSPNILWDIGIPPFKSLDSFKLFITNTPFTTQEDIFIFEPTIILSTYENFHYIAIYTQLFDIEARGFSRSISFVVVHQSNDFIQNVYHTHLAKMTDLVKSLQRKTLESAPHDLSLYALSLEKTNEIHLEPQLESKLNELQLYLKVFNVEVDRTLSSEPKDITYFTLIRNDLRSIFDITNFTGEFSKLFEDFFIEISNLPYDDNVLTFGDYQESNPKISFGAVEFPLFISQIKSFEDEEKLSEADELIFDSIFRSEIFYHCSFSILSGRTLIILSKNRKLSNYICKRFSICIPFYKDNYIRIVTKEISLLESIKYSIVIAEELIEDNNKVKINVLDLDNRIYKGEKCPIFSFIRKLDVSNNKFSYNIFFKNLFLKLKTQSFNLIMKLAELGDQRKEKIFKPENGLSKDDEPVYRYWILSYFNKHKLRPVFNLGFDETKFDEEMF